MNDSPNSYRDYGRVLEALAQGKEERAELRRMVNDIAHTMAELREAFIEMRSSTMSIQQRVGNLEEGGFRVSALEIRVGDLANRQQVTESFLSITKTWSLRVVVSVLIGLAFGASALGKIWDLLLKVWVK